MDLFRLVAANPAGIGMKALRKQLHSSALSAMIKECEAKGLIAVQATEYKLKAMPKKVRFIRLTDSLLHNPDTFDEALADLERNSPRQAEVVSILLETYRKEKTGLPEFLLTQRTGVSAARLHRLVQKGYAVEYMIELSRSANPESGDVPPPNVITLNAAQAAAVATLRAAVEKGAYAAFLLHGVTGSGKTQVYIESIKTVPAQGRAVITLVPEISLTPQLIGRYRAHFGEQVAVLHSRMEHRRTLRHVARRAIGEMYW